jgi:hypothetical protein
MLPVSDDAALLVLRRSPRYRAAVWVARLGNVVGLPFVVWMVAMRLNLVPRLSDELWYLLFAVFFLVLLCGVALYYRSGIWPHLRARSHWNVMLRDILGPRI